MAGTADSTIAIPAMHDDPEIFGRVLDLALRESRNEPIVVVDMSKDDALAGVCATRGARVRHHPFPESGGVSHSRNRCIELAETRHVAFLDSDAFVEPDWLAPLLVRLAEPDVAVAGSRVLPAWEAPPPRLMATVTASDWLSLFDLGTSPLELPRVMGTSYALDRERAPEPPFDESLGRQPGWPLAMEENVLCERCREAGWRVVYEPRSRVRHCIPADRASWRWMWRRAHTAGRETRSAGRFEALPRPRMGARDRLFQALVAPSFFAGWLARPRERDAPPPAS